MLSKISWVALRQIESIRESVAFTLKEGAVEVVRKRMMTRVLRPGSRHGLGSIQYRDHPRGTAAGRHRTLFVDSANAQGGPLLCTFHRCHALHDLCP